MKRIASLSKRALRGKSVLLRVDFNVEIARGNVIDDYRIRASMPTIHFLLSAGAKPILMSHRGRPMGKDKTYSLRPVAEYLSRILGRRVIFFEEWGDLAPFWRILPERTIGMLENLRFWPGEEKNDAAFARQLAELGDIYVNDAFAVSHRKNASVAAITRCLPAYAGFLLEREITMLEKALRLQKSRRPFVAVFGGKKLSDKLPLILRFQRTADAILTGGGVANTFLAAEGVAVGKSLVERSLLREARRMKKRKGNIIMPLDWRMGRKDGGKAIFDIGPKTERRYAAEIARARTLIWNGPMGLFEDARFAKGSYALARAVANNRRAFSVVGGGETVAVIRKLKLEKKISFVSTGGGAMLEYLAGKKLPGIEALKRQS